MTRFRYPTSAAPKRVYTHICPCGAEHFSCTKPGSLFAPKVCQACHLGRQRAVLERLMHRLPSDIPRARGA